MAGLDATPHSADGCPSWHPCKPDRTATAHSGRPHHRMVAPQVLVYHYRYGLPVTIVHDRYRRAGEIYFTERCDFDLDPEVFPVRTTAQVLNDLAANLDGVRLTRAEERELLLLTGAMWMRMSWAAASALEPSTQQRLVPREVLDCAHGIGCGPVVRWAA